MSSYRPRLAFWAACLGMLLFGIVLTTLGAVLPSVTERFGLGGASAGTLFSMMSLGIMAASVFFGPIVDRFGYKGMLVAATLLVFLGIEAIAFAPSMAVLMGAALLIGVGGGVLNGGTTALVADVSAGARSAGLNLQGVFFGIGAFGLPFILGMLLSSLGYTAVVAAMGGVVLLVLVFILAVKFPAPKQAQGFPLRDAARLVKDPVLLTLGMILFFQSGMEMTMGGWTSSYVSEVLALSPERALYLLSLYWLGMMLARLLLGTAMSAVPPRAVLLPSMATTLAGSVLLMTAETQLPAALGVFLVGAGFAAVFPSILSFVGDRYPHLSGTAFSLVLVMALTGGTLLPLATGVLGDRFGLQRSLLIVPAALVCAAALYLMVRRHLDPAPHAAAAPIE